MSSVSLKHICKKYPNGFEAVKDFNLEIEDQILGESDKNFWHSYRFDEQIFLFSFCTICVTLHSI